MGLRAKSAIESLVFILSWPLRKLAIDASKLVRLLKVIRLQSKSAHKIPITTQFDGKVELSGTGNVVFGEHCRLGDGVYIETVGEGRIQLGDNVRINKGTLISARTSITIGHDTLVGEYVSIRDANHGIEPNHLIRLQEHNSASIEIGDDVWVARGSVVLKGAKIGSGTIVAANSVVNSCLGDCKIYAGAPARLIRER